MLSFIAYDSMMAFLDWSLPLFLVGILVVLYLLIIQQQQNLTSLFAAFV